MDVLAVFLGGGLGATLRYGMSGMVHRIMGSDFPYGTLVVNILGCLLIGALMSVTEDRILLHPRMRLFLAIGLLGGFTTFSTFSYETVALLRSGAFLYGMLNVLLSVCVCLLATWIGTIIGKII